MMLFPPPKRASVLTAKNTASIGSAVLEINFDNGINPYSSEVYAKARDLFQEWVAEGLLKKMLTLLLSLSPDHGQSYPNRIGCYRQR
jgi:hypothetical protein